MTARTTAPIILNDVCPPLILFKVFLDNLVCNKNNEPLTHEERACLEGGSIALANAFSQLRVLHNYIDALETHAPEKAAKRIVEICGLALVVGDDKDSDQ